MGRLGKVKEFGFHFLDEHSRKNSVGALGCVELFSRVWQ